MTLNIYLDGGSAEPEGFITVLLDGAANIADRFHALFTLRTIYSSNPENSNQFVDALFSALSTSTPLLQHELCYILGQFKNEQTRPAQINHLNSVVFGEYSDIVRHEAAEALGALGGDDALDELLKFPILENDPHGLVKDTIDLAIQKYKYEKKNGLISSYFDAIDPTPALSGRALSELQKIVLNGADIVEKYSAMFALRNLIHEFQYGTDTQKSHILRCNEGITNIVETAISFIALGFKDESALLRHEVAYIFGQLAHSSATSSLEQKLADVNEHPIVRHECAEALGSIGNFDSLYLFVNDKEQIVRESCLVGLKMGEYAQVEC